MKTLVNISGDKAEAYFNGQYVRFKAGQKKMLEDGPADEIVRENEEIVFEKDVPKEPVVEEVAEVPAKKAVKGPAKKK